MASNDVRDILDVAPSTQPRPAKKAKVAVSRAQYAGMSKEVRGLMMGDGIAPVQVQEIQYKKKPKLAKRAQPWIREAFTNQARGDGLVLRHWWKSTVPHRLETPGSHAGAPVTPAESKVETDSESTKPAAAVQTNYPFARFNTKPDVPDYDNAQYDTYFTHNDWTREETDYLMQLARDFDLRWVVIWDRYDYAPKAGSGQQDGEGENGAVPSPSLARSRSMEELKARYYHVAAKMMEMTHPLSSMSTAEFDIHEKMSKFDPNREMTRKKLAEALLARSPEELREEEILLGELKRIVDNEERFLEERKDLYRRLDFPVSHGSIASYETSAGLQQLAMNLASQERSKKQARRSLAEGGTPGGAPAPATASGSGRDGPSNARSDQRAGVAPGKSNKKGKASAPPHRQLSPREEVRYGIMHHERLSSGVSFRQSRIEKLVLAKSAAQAQKLQDALAELEIPVRAVMPTDRVCTRYENLIREIHLLLDARKTSEKVHNEVKVLRAQREARERRDRGEQDDEADRPSSRMEVDGANEGEAEKKSISGKDNGDKKHSHNNAADAEDEQEEEKAEGREAGTRSDDEDENEEGEADTFAAAESEDGENDDEDAEAEAENEDDEQDEDDDDQADGSDAEAAVDDEDGEEDEEEEDGEDDEEENVEAEEDDEQEQEGDEGEQDEGGADVEDDEEGVDAEEEDADVDFDGANDDDEDGEAGGDDEEDEEEQVEEDGDGEEEVDEEPEQPEAVKAHKRSASVMSGQSTRSSKRTRR